MREFHDGIQTLAEDIAHDLLGTCMVDIFSKIDDAIEEGKLTEEEAKVHEMGIIYVVENITFQCVSCGWWCEAGDWYDNGNGEDECGDCHGDEDD